MISDRVFDGLAGRFERQIYSGIKGKVRLAVLQRDLSEFIDVSSEVSVLDVGAGLGQMSAWLMQQDAQVSVLEPSAEMMDKARALFQQDGVKPCHLEQSTFQEFAVKKAKSGGCEQYDLVVCHAVLEWVSDPKAFLESLVPFVRPGGSLSLAFYSWEGLVYSHLLKGNKEQALMSNSQAERKGLTPLQAIELGVARQWFLQLELLPLCHSGIRVFSDYKVGGLEQGVLDLSDDDLLALELKFSRHPQMAGLGRYQHFLLRRPLRENM